MTDLKTLKEKDMTTGVQVWFIVAGAFLGGAICAVGEAVTRRASWQTSALAFIVLVFIGWMMIYLARADMADD